MRLLPHVFERAIANTSGVRKGKGGPEVWWRIEWRFTTVPHQQNLPRSSTLDPPLSETPSISRPEEDTPESTFAPHQSLFQPIPSSPVTPDMLVLVDRCVPDDKVINDLISRFIDNTWRGGPTKHLLLPFEGKQFTVHLDTGGEEIDGSMRLGDALKGRTVLEFPALIVRLAA